jgi:competence protein ComEA
MEKKMTSQFTKHDPAARCGKPARSARTPFALAAQALALVALLLGLSPLTGFATEPVNINLASAEVLAESLQGVGIAKAHRIIEYREAHGPFEHIDELAAVQGIGPATVEKNRSAIRLQ